MDKIIKRVKIELKIQKVEFHPIQLCCLIKNVLKKYGHTFDIKKGYVNIDGFGKPTCFTYFWLEDDNNTKLDPLRVDESDLDYFFTDTILSGVECIDNDEQAIIKETNDLWGKINSNQLIGGQHLAAHNTVLRKHPNKNLVKL